ncbi:MAG: alpha/beta hydrolase [Tissierellia bacterium]|nr:alpha/beta hydrolase [Tissierellia bacterium]
MKDIKTISLSNGEELSYRQSGYRGKVILLLHGNYSSSVVWKEILDEFHDEYRLYAVDMRGFGKSSYHKPARTLQEYAKDIEFFIEEMGFDEIVLVGWSAGGGVAMEIAADLKEQVEKLILVSSVAANGYKSQYTVPIAIQQYARYLFPFQMYWVDQFNPYQKVSSVIANNRSTVAEGLKDYMYNRNEPGPEFFKEMINSVLEQRNNVDFWEAFSTFNITDTGTGLLSGSGRIKEITCPIVQFHGMEDRIIPYCEAKYNNKAFGKNSKLITFKNSGHSIMTDEKEKFVDELRNALAS